MIQKMRQNPFYPYFIFIASALKQCQFYCTILQSCGKALKALDKEGSVSPAK